MTNIERAKQLRMAIQFQAAALPDEQAAQDTGSAGERARKILCEYF